MKYSQQKFWKAFIQANSLSLNLDSKLNVSLLEGLGFVLEIQSISNEDLTNELVILV